MAFWSGERLALELPNLIDKFDPKAIDCASYRLSLGGQAFVTSDDQKNGPSDPLTQVMKDHPPENTIVISPGQFAFLLTEESVKVPSNALALISMRAKLKFQGLINVSGFHVDPGFSGRLLYGVYNAGPDKIILEKKQPLFLIVYADLDQDSKSVYKGEAANRRGIAPELIKGMTGQVFSPMLLQRQIKELEAAQRDLNNQLASMKGRDSFFVGLSGVVLTLLGIVFAAALAVAVTDWAKATAGMLFKGAIESYEQTVRDEMKKLPVAAPTDSSTSANAASETQRGNGSKKSLASPK